MRILTLLLLVTLAGAQERPAKKLLEYGWDVPYPDDVRANIREMEQKPFDGLLFRLRDYNHAFQTTAWTREQLAPQWADLEAIEWGTFRDNFLMLYAANRWKMDWFDDAQWRAIENNTRLSAESARRGKCVGVCFDHEPYGENPWAATAYRDRPFATVEAQVRKRGAQFMAALQEVMPDIKVLTFFQLSLFRGLFDLPDAPARQAALASHHYAFLPAFLNGMLDVAGPAVRLIDGNEPSYYYTSDVDYFRVYQAMKQKALTLVAPENRAKYVAQVQAGAAVYVDQVMALRERKVLSHFFQPEERPLFAEHNTYWALSTTDEYVWFYSEKMNWWKGQIPAGLEDAVRSARRKIAEGKPLGFALTDLVARAQKAQSDSVGAKLIQRSAAIAQRGDAPAPTIDGRLNDPLWTATRPLDPLVPLAETATDQPVAGTTVRVTHDAEHLYVAFRCDEPEMAKLQPVGEARDSNVWEGDCVEVMLSLTDQPRPYRHFIVNPNGVVWDGQSGAEGDDVSWNTTWQAAAAKEAKAWTAELAVPWAAIGGPPKPGSSRRANVCRQRLPRRELSAWSGLLSGFLEAERFGTWSF